MVIILADYEDGYDRDSDDDANDDDDDLECNAGSNPSVVIKLVDYFLNLFPVFTLSTNFPIIAITLRCRLQYFTANVDSSLAQSLYHWATMSLSSVSASCPKKDPNIESQITVDPAGTIWRR